MDLICQNSPSTFPDVESGESEKSEPVTTQDASNCRHRFILKGTHDMQCLDCGVGYILSGMSDFERICSHYAEKYGKD
jgi:hypothetical protein